MYARIVLIATLSMAVVPAANAHIVLSSFDLDGDGSCGNDGPQPLEERGIPVAVGEETYVGEADADPHNDRPTGSPHRVCTMQ